ncbi:MAG TPA: PQQ-dependent sugar dehydrogenase [Pyrinomonadaceae bacterium]|nr:PQQ-dependent sugar dehydrogenase [Pyrinomonadaceae bacterium]
MRYQIKRIALFTASLCLLVTLTQVRLSAATVPGGFTDTVVASGLSNPTAMAFAPDGRIFVCQQTGQLRVIKNGQLLATSFLIVTVDSSGERGLLGIAFDPNFTSNQFIYIYYTVPAPTGGSAHNRVSRFTASTANPDVVTAGSEVPLLDLNNLSSATNHNGGALHFGPDGKLYIAVGENANSANSQTLSNLLGKILRINSDGTIPTDNPFFNTATGNNRAIWAMGLRNPFTFGFQPGTGRLFINDVGQSTWEEINDGIAGSNYGWANCEGFCSPTNPSFRDPLFEYGHGSTSTTGCAIVGGAFYNPQTTQFPGSYVGKYFFADLCTGWIRRFDPSTSTATDFASGINTPVDMHVADDGSLYYLARGGGAGSSGIVSRIAFTTAAESGISGRIVDSRGAALGGVTVTLGGAKSARTITNANGLYSFQGLQVGNFYTVTPQLANYSFTPAARSITLDSTVTNATFDGIEGAPTANALDMSGFFVRQHYLDFLNREPDQSGWEYWTGQIDQCGTDAACIRSHRVGVSAAFFVENEFQQTGSFVYRLYRASYGVRPTFQQFMPDRSRIDFANLNASKQAFLTTWVQRPEFIAAYPNTMSNAEFVGKLFDTAGLTPFTTERQQQITAMNGGKTRAQVLGDVIEIAAFVQREYNPSFVLMQYFGYLRREVDQGGYDFWLGILNSKLPQDASGYRAMVCAFITSAEYQQRFSPVITHTNSECGQ